VTTSADIRALVATALKGATSAADQVYTPFDWPTAPGTYPQILVRAPKEHKKSLGKNAPLFDVTTTIHIVARTQSPGAAGDAGSAAALAAAEQLKQQIEVALINNRTIWTNPDGSQRISQFASVDSEISSSSEGSMPMAELRMVIEIEFSQGPDCFWPIPSTPLENFTGTIPEPDGTVEPTFSITFPNPIS